MSYLEAITALLRLKPSKGGGGDRSPTPLLWQPGGHAIIDMALNKVREAVYLIGSDARFIYVNDEAVRRHGYSREELLGMGLPDIDPDFPIERWRTTWAEVEAGGSAWQSAAPFESRHMTRDGRTFPVEITGSAVEEGGAIYLLALVRDISERKRAEQQRHAHVNLLNGQARVLELVATGAPLADSLTAVVRLIEEHAPGVIGSVLLLDEDGVHLHHGAAPGLSPKYRAAIDGMQIGSAAGSCGRAAYLGKAVYVRDIATNRLWRDFKDLALDEGLRASWSTPIFDAQGRVLGAFAMYARVPGLPDPEHLRLLGMASHITAIAIGRHRTEAALRLSEERYRSMVVATSTIVWMTSAQGKVVQDIPSWRAFSGQTCEEIMGDGWLDAVHPDDRAGTIATWRHALETRTPFQAPNRVRRHDGEYRYVMVAGVPVLEKDGEVREWIGTCTDVTDRVRARKEVERYRKHLEAETLERRRAEAALFQAQKMEAIGQLTGGVAHDFNNLLTAIVGNLDLLRGRLPQDAVAQRYARNAQAAVERASGITSKLLAFSRSQRLVSRAIDVNEVVRGMMTMARQTVGERIELEQALAPQLWAALADRHQLETALLNLVINARDAMPEGGVLSIRTANVEIEALQGDATRAGQAPAELMPGRYVALTVADTGHGVDPEVASRIFEPFVTTKEVGKGTGLGLSMVYGFARQSGGGVGFETAAGRGSAFTIYLPRTDAGTEARHGARRDELDEATAPGQEAMGSGTILVVEDERHVREVATTALASFGYNVVEASDGGEALRVLEQRPGVHMVFTDLVMPRGNGVDLARTIQQRWPHMPILLATGHTRTPADTELPPGLEVLKKPYRPAELGERVRQLLERRKSA